MSKMTKAVLEVVVGIVFYLMLVAGMVWMVTNMSGCTSVPKCNGHNTPCQSELPIADSLFRISDCPIIGQRYNPDGTFDCWHDCNEDGTWDRHCTYSLEYYDELGRIVTLRCTELFHSD